MARYRDGAIVFSEPTCSRRRPFCKTAPGFPEKGWFKLCWPLPELPACRSSVVRLWLARVLPVGSKCLQLLNRSTHSRGANSTSSKFRHGPRRWITSADTSRQRLADWVAVGVYQLVSIRPTHLLFRAIEVPAGGHRVALRFAPFFPINLEATWITRGDTTDAP